LNSPWWHLFKVQENIKNINYLNKNEIKSTTANISKSIINQIKVENDWSNKIDNFINLESENQLNTSVPFIFSKEKLDSFNDVELDNIINDIEQIITKYEAEDTFWKEEIRKSNPLLKFNNFDENTKEAIFLKLFNNYSTFTDNWAENWNFGRLNLEVLKISMNRHDKDYFSILQLSKFLISLERDLRDENKRLKDKNIEIKTANNGVILMEDWDWNNKRIIIQEFAGWTGWKSIDIALKEEFYNAQLDFLKEKPNKNCIWKNNNCKYKKLLNLSDPLDEILPEDFNTYINDFKSPLFIAYREFIQSIQNISDKKWYLLDITDSRQGIKDKRWNILNTSNVFVKNNNWTFEFRVIDPDVFNTDWRNKFSWKEQERTIIEKNIKEIIDWNVKYYKNKLLNILDAKKTWFLTELTNFARDWNDNKFLSKFSVAPKQEKYMSKILDNKEYNLEVDEKLKNDLIFWTNMSRLVLEDLKKMKIEI